MKLTKHYIKVTILMVSLLVATACHDLLQEEAENRSFNDEIDYTSESDMILPLLGVYAEFYARGWEDYPLISVRGDDVNAGGKDDQQDFTETDLFNYSNKSFWMYRQVWENLYKDTYYAYSAIDQIALYKENVANKALADQYMAEAKVLGAYWLFTLSRMWGSVFIPFSADPTDLLVAKPFSKDEVMQHISDQMDEVIPLLPALHPSERTDIPGGVTQYTALAIKALANLELENYQKVADATSQIISSSKFALEPEFYQLFKLKGKLNDENILELQYSDFGTAAGTDKKFPFDVFGPQAWSPKVKGATSGWGFFEPSLKYIKFMLDRNEVVRLQTSVLFTKDGIAKIKSDPAYATLPAWISHITPSGDTINNYYRALFASGKHYLPSEQLTPGRTSYGTNKNVTCIRYAEILLIHAEALTMGASSGVMTADEAVNAVRFRAGLGDVSGVTHDQVMDEKFAELAMEWGIRFYDMVRLNEFNELSYDGRVFTQSDIFLPYPQNQVDQLPVLQDFTQE